MIVSLLLFTPSTPTAACDFHSPTRRKARLSLLQASFLNAKLGIKTQLAGQARPCDATPTGHSQRVDAVVRACKAKEILCLGIKSCTLHACILAAAGLTLVLDQRKKRARQTFSSDDTSSVRLNHLHALLNYLCQQKHHTIIDHVSYCLINWRSCRLFVNF